MNLRLYIITFCLLFAGLALHGQAPEKRFVGNCRFSGFALLADSSYRGDIINFTDRMGDGYNLTQLAVGYEIFDGRGLVFEIDTIHESTNFTADVSVTARVDRGFAPFGSGQVYNPTENGLIPPSSQEQAGLSPTQKARIDRHNVVIMQSLIGGRDSVYSITNVPDTTGLSPVLGDAFINSTADTLGLYNGAGWVLFFGGGSIEVADGLTILGDGTGGDPLRVDTTLLATRTYADSLFLVADSLREAGDRSTPILIQAFDRIIQLDGCSTSETVITGFYLLDNEAIDKGAITFEVNASPQSITYDVYNADSTSYYFETSASRGAGVYFWEVSYTDADGNNVGDTNAFDVMAGTPDSVLTVVQDSILVLRVCGVEISRDTLPEGNPGTVTSVALSLPGEFAVSGSPVTSSGTLSGTWNTQAANTVLAGPDSGGAAAPTFRSLVASDITAGGGVTGSGTTNYLSKWTGSSDLGNSLIYDNGTNIGIGTISPGYKLDLVGSLNIPRSGVLYSSGVRALHFSENPINYGRNVFLGINAGNLTTTSFLNVAVGGSALSTVTTGSRNSALGYQALSSLTDGTGNTVIGAESMTNGLSDSYNTAIGTQVLQSGGNNWNIGIGFQTLSGGSGKDRNTVIGNQNMFVAANSDNNTIIGHNAARLNSVLADLTSINNATIVGYAAKPVNGSTNETIIGYDITGNGSNTVTIGNNNVTTHYLNGTGGVKISTGTTAQRPINALGVLRGNSTDSDIEWGDGVSWWKIPKSSVSTYTQGSVLFAGTSGQLQQDNSNLFWDNSLKRLHIGGNNPQRTLHVTGEVRVTDLTTDTPTRIVGADADGDLGEMTAGTGISFAGGQVSATFDIADVGTNLSADDVPVWDGAAFQPSGITSDGSTIRLTADFPFLGNYIGAPGVTENGYVLTYDNAEGGIILKEGGIPRQFVENVEVIMDEYTLLIGDVVGIAIDPTSGSETMTIGASPDSPGSPNPQITFDAASNNVLVGMDFGMVFEADNGIAGFARMGAQGGGTGPTSSPNVTVFEDGLIRVNSPDISFPSTEESTELGQVKVLVLEDSMMFYKNIILDKQSATYYEETERQYTLGTSPSADTVITIDTIGVAFAADSISIAAGLITNDRSTTVTWLVHYDFTYNSDEDPCYSFFDLTTDGSEVPAAIAGSSAYSNQVSVLGTQHPGRSFLVSVPAGQAIRLCVKGNILAATEMNISYLTISIEEK